MTVHFRPWILSICRYILASVSGTVTVFNEMTALSIHQWRLNEAYTVFVCNIMYVCVGVTLSTFLHVLLSRYYRGRGHRLNPVSRPSARGFPHNFRGYSITVHSYSRFV